jgi:hypothetical protein
MAKRNIEVKEKALIDKLNSAVEGKKKYEAPKARVVEAESPKEIIVEDERYYKDDVKETPNTVTLTPRNPDGTFMEGYDDTEYNPKDTAKSRTAVDRQNDKEYIEKMRAKLTEARENINKDTQMRTPTKETEYEYVNHPKHYNNYDVEVIDMMIRVFGTEATAAFCKLNAFKYRMRAGTKPDVTVEQDLDKEKWYLKKYEELNSPANQDLKQGLDLA